MVTRIIKVLLGSFITITILWVVGSILHPPLLAVGLILAGRGPSCSTTASIRSFYRWYNGVETIQGINKQSRVVEKAKDGSGLQRTETPWGVFWEPDEGGSAVVAQISEITSKYRDFAGKPIHTNDVVLDCGANVGTFTRFALREGAKLVVAIEPAPKNVESLRRNFAKEITEGRVIVYPKGVWDKDDFLFLAEHHDTSAMDSFVIEKNTAKGVQVPLTTIDKMVAELKLPRVDFIKMDIEGAEQKALQGGATTIKNYRPRMEMSVNHLPDDPQKVPALLLSLVPSYRSDCLVCQGDWTQWRVRSEILFFQ